MSPQEYEEAIAEFLRKKGITKCPPAFAAPTRSDIPEDDRKKLRRHADAQLAQSTTAAKQSMGKA
jgi:hypothetical protein